MECPKCRTANPDSSRYCGTCAAPLRPPAPGDSPSLTTTIDPLERGLSPGTLVAGGKYRILGEIGRGGMGIVYEADDLKLKRTVALKFLPAELTDDPEARSRFVREAQAASVIDNPHICTIHDIGESEDHRMFIAMALCSGESLRSKIRRGPLPPAEALSIAAQVADGLAAAHARGVIHRDVKPANILFTREGTARVADFGLAKIAGEARLTRADRAVGTVAYMSPEQLRGEDADARSDVWSLGVVLYEMLTGALPFHGTTEHSLAYDIVNGEPKPLSTLPPGTPAGCVPLLERAMAKDPGERFASAVEMAEAIAGVAEAAGSSGRPHARSAPARALARDPAARRRRLFVRAGLSVLVAAAALSVIFALKVPSRLAVLLGLSPASTAGRGITVFTPTVLGEDPADRTLAAGLAEYLRRRLDEIARRSHSWITPGGHLEAYQVQEAADARRVLGAGLAVTGTLKRVGDNISLTLDVVDTTRLRRLASIPKTDHIANIATWQDDLVRETAAALGLALPATPPVSPVDFSRTTVPAAFKSYVLGLGAMAATPATLDSLAAAIASFEAAARSDPSFAAASVELAEAYRQAAGPAKDRSYAVRAEALAASVLETSDAYPQAHVVRGAALRSLGREAEALPEFERATALDPLCYDAWIDLAYAAEDMNAPAKAEAAYQAAIRARPGYWAARSFLALFRYYHGAYEEARDELAAVSRACPGNVVVMNDLGAVLFKMADYDQATAVFERSNSVKRNPDACANLATLYYYSGRYADSVTMNEAAIGFGPTDFLYVMYGNLGDAYRFTPGNEAKAAEAYAQAIALTEKALAGDPGNARARATLAVDLAKSGQAARAREELEAVLRAMPGDSSVVQRAVFAYEILGDRAKALEMLREYVKLKGPLEEIVRDPFLAGLRRDPGFADITVK